MKVYITAQALSNGIYEREAEYVETSTPMADTVIVKLASKKGEKQANEKKYKKPDWHLTIEEALTRAEEMRTDAVQELTDRFDRLTVIDFKVFTGNLKIGKTLDVKKDETPEVKAEVAKLEAEHKPTETKAEEVKPVVAEVAKPVEEVKPPAEPVATIGTVISKEDLAKGDAPIFTPEGQRVDPPPPVAKAVDLTPEQVGMRERHVSETATLTIDTHVASVEVPVATQTVTVEKPTPAAPPVLRQRLVSPAPVVSTRPRL